MTAATDHLALFRALPDLYILFGLDGTILDHTDRHVASALVPREQTVGRHVFAVYPSASPESERQMQESLDFVRTHYQPHTLKFRYDLERPAEQGGGTEERHWELTHYPFLDAAGELRGILQHPQDVTARVRTERERAAAEAALAEQRSFTDFVLDTLPLIVWTTLPDGTTAYLNQEWYTFTGQDPAADLATLDTTRFIHPDDLAAVMSTWQRATQAGTVHQFEYRLRRHDGQYRWLLGRSAPRHDATTGAITLWASCATDIHEQRTLVRELEAGVEEQAILIEQAYQVSRDARHQHNALYELFRQAPAIISVVRGPQHRYEFVNALYQNLFPHRELVGRTVTEALPEVVEQGIIAQLDDVYRTGETFYGNEVPIALERTAGSEPQATYFNFIYKRFDDENGQPAGIMCFAFEVTELVRARQDLDRLANPGMSAPA